MSLPASLTTARTARLSRPILKPFTALRRLSWMEALGLLCVTLLLSQYDAPFIDMPQFYWGAQAWPEPYQAVPMEHHGTRGTTNIFTPWSILLFLPFSFLSFPAAGLAVRVFTVICLHLLTGRSLWRTAVVCLSARGVALVSWANLDGISAVGSLLPGAGGLLLLAVKPHAAGLAALPLGLALLREKRWWQIALFVLAIALPTLLWPEWIERTRYATHGWWNVSPFPYTLPIAALLLWFSLRRRDPILAAIATPLASPYVTMLTLSPALALILRRWPRLGVVLAGGSWLLTAYVFQYPT